MGAALFHADGRTDGRDESNSRLSQLLCQAPIDDDDDDDDGGGDDNR
jgi:hypothetical protein